MKQSVQVATEGVKELDRQVSAYQVRLEEVQSKISAGKKEMERLEAEIAEKRDLWHKELEAQNQELVKRRSELNQERVKFEQDRENFRDQVRSHEKERTAFEDERYRTFELKRAYEGKEQIVGEFIRMVKSGAEKLV